MKKSLIALAVMSAATASMAQVTVSGELGFGWLSAQPLPNPVDNPNGQTSATVKGFQMSEGAVTITAVEDLGGGYKATATSSVALKGRDTAVTAKDATLALLTPVGQLTLGAVNTSENKQKSRAFAGAKINLPDDAESTDDNVDLLAFTTMAGPVYLTLAYSEAGSNLLNKLATKFGPLLQGGSTGSVEPGGAGAGQGASQITSFIADYSAGPVSLGFGIDSYDVHLNGPDLAAKALFTSAYGGRLDTNISASYDVGVAKIGAGYSKRGNGWAPKTKAGVSVPMGAVNIGLTYEYTADDSATLGNGVTGGAYATGGGCPFLAGSGNIGDCWPLLQAADFKGEAERTKVRLGIDYALSKSTSFNASFGWYKKGTPVRPGSSNILGTGLAQASNVSTNETQIMLMKRF